MSFRLRSYNSNPPGGYPYEQTGPKPHKFRAEPMIEAQANNVLAYRRANGLGGATFDEALRDVDRYQCQRLGNNARFCVSCDAASGAVAIGETHPSRKGCSTCGAVV